MAKEPLDKLRRLKQTDEIWEGSFKIARTWITKKKQPPHRPFIALFVDDTGRVLVSQMFEEYPTTDMIWELLCKAMRRPMFGAGRSRRPAKVCLAHKEYVEALTSKLESIDVRCEFRQTLPALTEAFAAMESWLNRGQELLPGLLSIHGMTPPLIGHLYTAAAEFYQAAPWLVLNDNHPIEIRYPPDAPARFAVVMGSGREVYGISIQDSENDLQHMYDNVEERDLTQEMSWMALFFERAIAMSFDDLDDLARYGWPVQGENAYPIFGRTRPGNQIGLPTRQDLLWLAGALPACVTYFKQYMKKSPHPKELELTVSVLGNKEKVYLGFPGVALETYSGVEPGHPESGRRGRGAAKQRSRRRIIERNLRRALLEDGPLVQDLFEYELEEHIDDYLRSKRQDNDKYFLAVTENRNHVAILLIDEDEVVHVNEDAREALKTLWKDLYQQNLEKMIPDMARELDTGYLYIAGIKVVDSRSRK
ncbi:MAG: hypothetical protein JXB07_09235 [Anaerolineae bacterium]|nr:hypothetical protein [Anaerolineae bacterium]